MRGSRGACLASTWLTPGRAAIAGGSDLSWAGTKATVQQFDQLYGQRGYSRIRGLDYRVKPGTQRLVLYGTVRRDASGKVVGIEPTHAAVQMPDGTWRCKVGGLALIEVSDLNQLRGSIYGLVIATYVRDRPAGLPGR